jgi:hypothetical protein
VQQLLASPDVQVPVADMAGALAAVGTMLAQQVVCPAAGGAAAAAVDPSALRLTCPVNR